MPALAQQAAPGQGEAAAGQAGHLVNGFVQREQALVARVMAEHAREGAPQARVRARIPRQAVGSDHGQRMAQEPAHVFLVHAEVHRAGRLQAVGGFMQRHPPVGGDRRQHPSALIRMRFGPGDQDVVGVGDLFQVQGGSAGRVRIAVAGHVMLAGGVIQPRQHFAAAAPVVDAGAFQVRHPHRGAAVVADRARFVQCGQDAGELVAQMGGVEAIGGQVAGQFQHLARGRGERGGVGQPGAQAKRALGDRRAQLRPHRRDLLVAGGAIQPIHVVLAQRGVPDQRGDVQCRTCVLHRAPVVGEARIAELARLAEQVHRVGYRVGGVHRTGTDAAVADHDRGDALRQLAGHGGIADDFQIVVGMHVDEAWADRPPAGVDDARRVAVQAAHRGDAAGADADVAARAGGTAAIQQQGIADQQVVTHQSPSGRRFSPPR